MGLCEQPIFIRGMSRSGGTLVVTLLDSHSEIAMSYELYPTLLAEKPDINLTEFKNVIQKLNFKRINRLPDEVLPKLLKTFIARVPRGGLEVEDLVKNIDSFIDENKNFSDDSSRLEFIQLCCEQKMRNEKKKFWGLKCNNQFSEYSKKWPKAKFINIIRDGRDVLASQMNTGSFSKGPGEIGKGWQKTHLKFRKLVESKKINGLEVFYEKLATSPEEETKKICDFLEVSYEPDMLAFNQKGLTIFDANHLSMDRISKPIDATQVGRYKKDLTEQQVNEFIQSAESAMREFGYI